MSENITLKKIAEILNISISTVSKALKDYDDVGEETKKKVRDLAQKLSYKPNALALNLRNQESKTIALLVPEITHHFFSQVIDGAVETATEKGYFTILLQSNESYEREKSLLEVLLEKNIDGVLVSVSEQTTDKYHIQKLIDRRIPVVFFDRYIEGIDASKVIVDDTLSAIQATQHLIDIGCKKIIHITGTSFSKTVKGRYIGYKEALQKNGFSFEESFVYNVSNQNLKEGERVTEQILSDHPDVDGVFCHTDPVACTVLKKMNELSISVPDRVAVIGFSNWFSAQITNPTLSSIGQRGYDMGKKSASLLIEEIQHQKKGTPCPHQTIVIPTNLIVRDSTKRK